MCSQFLVQKRRMDESWKITVTLIFLTSCHKSCNNLITQQEQKGLIVIFLKQGTTKFHFMSNIQISRCQYICNLACHRCVLIFRINFFCNFTLHNLFTLHYTHNLKCSELRKRERKKGSNSSLVIFDTLFWSCRVGMMVVETVIKNLHLKMKNSPTFVRI